jgi:hypothetical protein
MNILPYIIYLEMQPNALLLPQNFIIRKKWVLQTYPPLKESRPRDSGSAWE